MKLLTKWRGDWCHTLEITVRAISLHSHNIQTHETEIRAICWRSRAYGKFGFHWPADYFASICDLRTLIVINGLTRMDTMGATS